MITYSYHCLFCHGYEERGAASAGVLALGEVAKVPAAVHLSRMAKRLAKRVVVYTDGAAELAEQLAAALGGDPAVSVDNRRVARLQRAKEGSESAETIVHLEGGEAVSHGFLVSKTGSTLHLSECMQF